MEKYKVEERIKICFKDLSNPLKAAIIASWCLLSVWAVAFIAGVIAGVLSV